MRPWQKVIEARRTRLTNVTKELEQFVKEAKEKPKKVTKEKAK